MPNTTRPGAVVLTEPAPAKINLALHVTGQRVDGYHLLETLVTFTNAGDLLQFSPANEDSFSISGRFSAPLLAGAKQQDNLVLRARDMLRAALVSRGVSTAPVAIHLEKNLPIASGIGGGSADAAASLRGLMRFWNAVLPTEVLDDMTLQLGADVPMCFHGIPLIARGIGEKIEPVERLPELALVLANPLKAVSTPQIFRALESKNNGLLPDSSDAGRMDEWMAYLASTRNDLEAPARTCLAEIGEISDLLRSQDATMVRMSGSGATCFGIFSSMHAAKAAEANLCRQRPDWYFQATQTKSGRTS
jgi:4-diphosphocytidyl-2-C-methyl-D-erythritol kinase